MYKPIPDTYHNKRWIGKRKEFRANPISFIRECKGLYGDIFQMPGLGGTTIVTTDSDIVKHILQTNNRNYTKSRGYQIMGRALGKGLLTSEGEFWFKQRKLIQPAFHRKKLQHITVTMGEIVERCVERWKGLQQSGKAFDMLDEMNQLTMEIVARGLFGSDINKEDLQTVSDAVDYLNMIGTRVIRQPFLLLFQWVPVKAAQQHKVELQKIEDILFKIIDQRQATGQSYDDLLGMLLDMRDEETGEAMSRKQLRDEVVILFIAGHETTSNALTWTWYLLAQHPEVWEKLQAEWKEHLNGRSANFHDFNQLPYTRMVLNESMRLRPPAWIIGRQAVEDDEVKGYKIDAGRNVLMCSHEIHRHPDHWERPNEFWPEHFTKERMKARHKYAYLPFGGGPRLCIGNNFALLEMVIALSTLGQHFRPQLAEAPEGVEALALITLKPGEGIQMRL